ncbi:hypothetical protein [Paenibacillus hexagrammi]|uniref:Sporulation inhibitor A n=1 Tax=Paenibacillus hexagrammi TaxID=2908839 RepID=A0ABY3SLQ8_9BACL|nr:hypothetical protein [Paenibacillus sp. YPD9-1]UJF34886.1 hypothetical protein L0M14_06970 [Paenibacillus sp. YPD9-1]
MSSFMHINDEKLLEAVVKVMRDVDGYEYDFLRILLDEVERRGLREQMYDLLENRREDVPEKL